MRVARVDADDRRTVRAWVGLPHAIYDGDPAWTPLLRGDAIRAVTGPGPAGVTTARFLARDGREPVGRITVSDEPDGEETGVVLLTDYEAVDDPEVALALLDAASEWARARGRNRLAGPRGRLVFGMITGLQIDGFDHPAPAGTPHHRPYYREQWESVMGMTQMGHLVNLATTRDRFQMPPAADQLETAALTAGYRIVRYRSFAEIADHGEFIRHLANVAMAGLPNWLLLHRADLPEMIRRLKRVLTCPEWFVSIEHSGQIVGFMTAYPEMGAALRRTRGRLWPTGWWHLSTARHRTDTATFLVAAIAPEHQGRGAGILMAIALARALVAERHLERIEFVLGDIDNDQSLAFVTGLSGASETARFAVYERVI